MVRASLYKKCAPVDSSCVSKSIYIYFFALIDRWCTVGKKWFGVRTDLLNIGMIIGLFTYFTDGFMPNVPPYFSLRLATLSSFIRSSLPCYSLRIPAFRTYLVKNDKK